MPPTSRRPGPIRGHGGKHSYDRRRKAFKTNHDEATEAPRTAENPFGFSFTGNEPRQDTAVRSQTVDLGDTARQDFRQQSTQKYNPEGLAFDTPNEYQPLPDDHPLKVELAELKKVREERKIYWVAVAERLGAEWDDPNCMDRARLRAEEELADKKLEDLAVQVFCEQRGMTSNTEAPIPTLRHRTSLGKGGSTNSRGQYRVRSGRSTGNMRRSNAAGVRGTSEDPRFKRWMSELGGGWKEHSSEVPELIGGHESGLTSFEELEDSHTLVEQEEARRSPERDHIQESGLLSQNPMRQRQRHSYLKSTNRPSPLSKAAYKLSQHNGTSTSLNSTKEANSSRHGVQHNASCQVSHDVRASTENSGQARDGTIDWALLLRQFDPPQTKPTGDPAKLGLASKNARSRLTGFNQREQAFLEAMRQEPRQDIHQERSDESQKHVKSSITGASSLPSNNPKLDMQSLLSAARNLQSGASKSRVPLLGAVAHSSGANSPAEHRVEENGLDMLGHPMIQETANGEGDNEGSDVTWTDINDSRFDTP